MDDLVCPRCKTTKYRNPSLKLMVNVCGHTLCESCVDLLFLKGSGSCPECLVPLKRSNFRIQLFDDAKVEKEVDIRRRILRDYNKKEDDFETLEEYNNYLEEIEILIYNLVHNIDIINTNKKIEQYKRENREIINRNKTRIGKEQHDLEEMLEIEKQQEEQRQKELDELEELHKKRKMDEKEALIEELAKSREDPNKILNTFVKQIEKTKEEAKAIPKLKPPTQFSSGIQFSGHLVDGFRPVPKLEEGPLYVHQLLEIPIEGPSLPTEKELETKGYIRHIRCEQPVERAGGFTAMVPLQRALLEAFQGLFHGS